MVDFLIKINKNKELNTSEYIFIKYPENCKNLSSGADNLFLWGDPILPNDKPDNEIACWEINKLLSFIY